MNEYTPRVTGKQVLNDAVTLAKDTGSYIFELGKRVFFAVKNAIEKNSEKKPEPKPEKPTTVD